MGTNYFTNPIVFVLDVIFSIYILFVMLRFLLQVVRADPYNPLAQFLVKVTNPALRPLRRIVPTWGRVDLAAVVLMLALQITFLIIVLMIKGAGAFSFGALFFSAVHDLLRLAINVFFFAILIQVIISWINPGGYNPALALIYNLTEPVLRPAQRILPPVGGLDLSPLVAMVGLQLLNMLLLPPIQQLARAFL